MASEIVNQSDGMRGDLTLESGASAEPMGKGAALRSLVMAVQRVVNDIHQTAVGTW